MKRIMYTLSIAAILTGVSLPGVAQDAETEGDNARELHRDGMHHKRPGGRFGDPQRMLERMTRHLELDDNQAQQVSNIFIAAKPEIDVLRQDFKDNRRAMHALESGDPDYSVKLQNLSAANADLAAQMTLLHGRVRADIDAVLTPEQQDKIRERGERGHRRQNQAWD